MNARAVAVLVLACGATVAARQWPTSVWPAPLPARTVAWPSYEMRTLPNGLRVLAVVDHKQPAISFRVLVRAGALEEPAGKPGVARLVAALLDHGTATRLAPDLATQIDAAGGVIGAGSGNETAFVNGAVVVDRADEILGIAADMLAHPVFAADEIDRQRRQTKSSLRVSYDDPGYVADHVFNRLVFGAHPYGNPNEGTPGSIDRLTRDDLVAFHRTWYVPNNAIVGIVGDLTLDEAFAAADRAFGGWARGDVPEVRPPLPPAPAWRVVVVDRPGSAQTEIRVGNVAIARTHPDQVALDLAARILGGEGANRLYGVLRTSRGLAYSASADLHSYRDTGDLVAATSTRAPATAQVLRLVVDECVRLQHDRVAARELRGVQDFVSGSFPLAVETPAGLTGQMLDDLFHGLDPKALETYADRVGRVTATDVQRAAQTFLKPDRLSIVLVGDASAFVDQLDALGFATYERVPLAELDLASPTLKRGS